MAFPWDCTTPDCLLPRGLLNMCVRVSERVRVRGRELSLRVVPASTPVSPSLSCENSPETGLRPTLTHRGLILTIHVCKDPLSKYGHMLRFQESHELWEDVGPPTRAEPPLSWPGPGPFPRPARLVLLCLLHQEPMCRLWASPPALLERPPTAVLSQPSPELQARSARDGLTCACAARGPGPARAGRAMHCAGSPAQLQVLNVPVK